MPFADSTVGHVCLIRRIFEISIVLDNEIVKYFTVYLILFLGADDRTSIHFVSHATDQPLCVDFELLAYHSLNTFHNLDFEQRSISSDLIRNDDSFNWLINVELLHAFIFIIVILVSTRFTRHDLSWSCSARISDSSVRSSVLRILKN